MYEKTWLLSQARCVHAHEQIGACQTLTVEVTAKPKRRPAVSLKDVKGELEMQVTHGGYVD